MKIPEKINVCGIDVVVSMSTVPLDGGALGNWDKDNMEIVVLDIGIREPSTGIVMYPKLQMQTFYHELMHCIFCLMGRQKEEDNEGLVDGLAYALLNVFPQLEGK